VNPAKKKTTRFGTSKMDRVYVSTAFYTAHSKFTVKSWNRLGGLSFGVPCTDETVTPDGVGRFNHFDDSTETTIPAGLLHGGARSIYWTPGTGACAIIGEIRQRWAKLGWEASPLGYPTTDELTTPDGVGRFNHFSGGGSIYWTPAGARVTPDGTKVVSGSIGDRWAALGWERSYLGYPTSEEVVFTEGGRAQTFENGTIYWWSDLGAIDLDDVVLHYTGLYCFDETTWDQGSTADEPYVTISVTTPEIASVLQSRIYEEVEDGVAKPDPLEIYRGKPYGINIGCTVMEYDFGDPNKYKEDIQKAVMAVRQGGTLALGLIPGVGPIIAAVAGPVLGTLMPSLGGALSDAFGWGDDQIGSANLTISAKQMVILATRTDNSEFEGIGFKIETPRIEGLGASYKVYCGIVPV
jgi:hypothetical protein